MPEWAQLRAGSGARSSLERGMWYAVEHRGEDGFVDLAGPDGEGVSLSAALLRIIDREPSAITRVQETEILVVRPGEAAPPVSYYGICPRRHWIGGLAPHDIESRCPECQQIYPVEDEAGA